MHIEKVFAICDMCGKGTACYAINISDTTMDILIDYNCLKKVLRQIEILEIKEKDSEEAV